MVKIPKNTVSLLCLVVTLLIAGCQSSQTTKPTTMIKTAQRVSSQTPVFTNTLNPMIPPTSKNWSSPLPTFAPKEAKALLLSLLQKNGNCQFPCLWGFTPGKINFKDLRNTFAPFGEIDNPGDFSVDSIWSEDSGRVSFELPKNDSNVIGEFTYSQETPDIVMLNAIGPKFKTSDNFSPLLENFNYYLLPQVLSNYGPPSEIIIGVFPSEPNRPNEWVPMNLGLFYSTKGFYIEYILTKQGKKEYFVGCPTQVVELSLVTWNPAKPKTLLDIAKIYPTFWGIRENVLNEYYHPITQALSMTPNQFYEKYKNIKNNDCMMVPISLWSYK